METCHSGLPHSSKSGMTITRAFFCRRETSKRRRADYFQPDSLSQAAISAGCVFSQAVIDLVSSDDILPFMHEQQAATTSAVAPSLLLSLTHFLIQAASSASARAIVLEDTRPRLRRTANSANVAFIAVTLLLLFANRRRTPRGGDANVAGHT